MLSPQHIESVPQLNMDEFTDSDADKLPRFFEPAACLCGYDVALMQEARHHGALLV